MILIKYDLNNYMYSNWFEPRGISCLSSVMGWLIVVLSRTVVGESV